MNHQVRTEGMGWAPVTETERAPEYEIAALLARKKLRVTTAESCTGGLIAGTLVNVPGISAWFEEGAARAAHADAAVISTGIAGPDGGTEEKPVGLVYIGCFCRGKTRVEKHLFQGDRGNVRGQSVQAALLLLKSMLCEAESGE